MHEDGGGLGVGHQLLVDLVVLQQRNALGPDLVGLAHGDPDVGVDHVGVGAAFLHVLGQTDGAAVLSGDLLAGRNQALLRPQLLGAAGGEVHAQLGGDHHQRVGHVVPGVAHEGEVLALDGAEVLLDGEDVGQHLGGVELVGQAVPNGNAGVLGQIVHDGLVKAAVLNAVVDAAQDTGGIRDGFLLAHLGAAGIQIGHTAAQIHAGHLKGAAGTGRGLLEQQNDVLAGQVAMGLTGHLLALEFTAEVQQIADLLGGVVQQLQEIASSEIDRHGRFLLFSLKVYMYGQP